ncbi:hypothetical protein ACFQ0I_12975 [Mariniflexile aquimaris]|uniref:Uncharacterized protein n=1 Tax=Mariniflexile aquimaris TaxID=881009 RepID=A0ABW3BVW9_9FLAO
MDDFKFSWENNKNFIDQSNSIKFWNIAFKQSIIQNGGIIREELYCKSKITNQTRVFRLIKLSRLSIDNYLSDVKYLN